MRAALIDQDGVVRNVITLPDDEEEGKEYEPPKGLKYIVDKDKVAQVGGTYDKTTKTFAAPVAEEVIPDPTLEEIIAEVAGEDIEAIKARIKAKKEAAT